MEQYRWERDDVFGERSAMRYGELVAGIKSTLKKSPATADRRVKEWRQHGLIEKSAANLWSKKD